MKEEILNIIYSKIPTQEKNKKIFFGNTTNGRRFGGFFRNL